MQFIANIANDEWAHDLPRHDTDAENDKEFATQEPVWQKIRENFLASSDSAEELHEFIKLHHWGEADDFLILIENPACDRNTARLIFWLSGPEFFRRKFATCEDAEGEDQKKWMDLITRVMKYTVSGKYSAEDMPEDYKDNVPSKNEHWEVEPIWEIDLVMYGEL